MKNLTSCIITSFVLISIFSCTGKPTVMSVTYPNTAKQTDTTLLIRDEKTAIAKAEPILFKTYGRKHILDQKPYKVRFQNNQWHINGTLPEGHLGGCFSITLDARDGKVIELTHYK